MTEYVAPAGSCAAPAAVMEHSTTAANAAPDRVSSVLCCTSARLVQCCSSARRRVQSSSTSGTPCFTTEHAPTAAYAAHEAGCDEDASPKSTCGPLETMHTDVAASNGSSMATVEIGQDTSDGEDSGSDAPYTPELDTIFDALVELAGGDGRDWVPVRQILAQTSLQLERLEELLEEWECMGVSCRDDTRLDVALCLSVTDALETSIDARLLCTNREVQSDLTGRGVRWHNDWRVLDFPCGGGTERSCVFLNSMAPEQR